MAIQLRQANREETWWCGCCILDRLVTFTFSMARGSLAVDVTVALKPQGHGGWTRQSAIKFLLLSL